MTKSAAFAAMALRSEHGRKHELALPKKMPSHMTKGSRPRFYGGQVMWPGWGSVPFAEILQRDKEWRRITC